MVASVTAKLQVSVEELETYLKTMDVLHSGMGRINIQPPLEIDRLIY